MAQWTLWILVVSFGGLGVTGYGVILVLRTLGEQRKATQAAIDAAAEARRQANVAERQFRYSHRPVLEVTVTQDNFLEIFEAHDEDEIRAPLPRVRFELKNVGQGAAIIREFRSELAIRKDRPVPEPDGFSNYHWQDVRVLAVGETFKGVQFRYDDLDFEEIVDLDRRAVRAYWIGLIRYSDNAGHGWEFGFIAEYERSGLMDHFQVIYDPPHFFDREVEN